MTNLMRVSYSVKVRLRNEEGGHENHSFAHIL
jgi:hypothetical protein